MSEQNRKMWPYKPRTAFLFLISILIILVIALAISRTTYSWPSPDSEKTVLLGIFVLSLLPILLMLADIIIERGASVEIKGVKIDFSQAQMASPSSITIPANIGVPGQAVADSGTNQILDALRQAVTSDMAILDLEEGQAWWETRLLVLLSGAVRHNQPKTIVFVGTDGGIRNCFQGWGVASDLLPHLLKVHPKYPMIYHSVLAAVRQWELVEPGEPNSQPPQPAWMQPPGQAPGLASSHPWMAFDYDTGLPNKFFAEQLLASELGEKIEQVESPRTISIVRLEELFRPVLHRAVINETWPSERQLSEFFDSDSGYIAVTQNGKYSTLVSRQTVLNAIVKTLVEKKQEA